MTKICVREATNDDLDFLHKLEVSSFPTERQSSRRSIKSSISNSRQIVYVIEHIENKIPNKPVGSAIIFIYKHSMRIYSIAVDKNHRGQGIGDFFMQYIIGFAMLRGFQEITLEADAGNSQLVDWYKRYSFKITKTIDDYYGEGLPAFRMARKLEKTPETGISNGNIIVVENTKKWTFDVPNVEIVAAKDYLTEERFRNSESFHVLNLCNSYKTHTIGYYVSLLASARNHRILPSVMTMKDITNIYIAQSLIEEITDFLDKRLKNVKQYDFEITVMLGKTPNHGYSDLAKKLFTLFEIPFFHISFIKNGSWKVKKLNLLNIATVSKNHPSEFYNSITSYINKKRYRRTQLKKYKYDLAILINNEEKTPPSCPAALNKFKKAAEETGFFVEFITKDDYRRICEFDALFIRETTAIESHTYKFARRAYTEGLVVIDDPWSILLCSNKIYLHERLTRGKIRQPQSWLLTKNCITPTIIKNMSFPLVLKLPESSFSIGVYRVNNPKELHAKLETMFAKNDLVIAQEFLKSEFDWRIGVLDNTPLFACKYYMANGHWQIYNWADNNSDNFSGTFETVPINQAPAHILKAAVKSSSLIGDGLYGVDLKEIDGQAYVIEINDNPNIDNEIEDLLLGDELYLRIMNSFFNRIERERHQPRYLT